MRILLITTILALGAAAYAQTTDIVRNNITWTISGTLVENTDYGTYANGDKWVIGPITITAIDPAPTSTENGTVIDPVWAYSGGSQGFDSTISSVTYDASLNIYNEFPKAVPANSSVVSTISAAGNPTYGDIDQMEILTVVSDAPPANSFRPPYIGRNGGALLENWTTGDLNYDALGDYDISGLGGLPDISTYDDQFAGVWYEQVTSYQGRFMHPEQHMPDYGREMANITGNAGILLNGNYTDLQKQDLLINFVQYGIDIYGVLYHGGRWSADGGHNHGRLMPYMIARATLGDTNFDTYLSANYPNTGEGRFQELQQTFFVTQADIDQSRYTADGRPRTPYTSEDIGKPEWGEKHVSAPQRDGDNWDAYYRGNGGGRLQAPALIAKLIGLEDEIGTGDAFFEYAERHIYYRQDRYADPQYYNGWDDGDAYGDGNTSDADPFSGNQTPSFHSNFYLAFEDADPVSGSDDMTAPVVSNETVASKTDTTATITFDTDEGATAYIDYDIDSGAPYASQTTPTGLNLNHSIQLTGLTASTTYYYRIYTEDTYGNGSNETEASFTTNAATTQVATPTFSPVAGEYWDSQSVTISATGTPDSIEYTTDGTDPDGDDNTYSTPVTVSNASAAVRLKAVASKSGQTDSEVGISDYQFSPWNTLEGIWLNIVYPTTTTAFTETMYVLLADNEASDLVVGLGVQADNYNDLAIMFRFSTEGVIEARNGGTYQAENPLVYTDTVVYKFEITDVDFGNTYDLTVTPGSGSPVVIADDYAWRSDWTGTTTINSVGLYDSIGSGGVMSDTNGELIGSSGPGSITVTTVSAGSVILD